MVDISREEYSWQVVVLEWHGWWIDLTIDLNVSTRAVVVECEIMSYDGLSVPDPRTVALA